MMDERMVGWWKVKGVMEIVRHGQEAVHEANTIDDDAACHTLWVHYGMLRLRRPRV